MTAAGTDGYLAELRANGLPRPDDERPGFPYGATLLPSTPVRGLAPEGAARLGASGIPITVIPAEPEDPFHTRSAALALAAAIPDAALAVGAPTAPRPDFATARHRFAIVLDTALRAAA